MTPLDRNNDSSTKITNVNNSPPLASNSNTQGVTSVALNSLRCMQMEEEKAPIKQESSPQINQKPAWLDGLGLDISTTVQNFKDDELNVNPSKLTISLQPRANVEPLLKTPFDWILRIGSQNSESTDESGILILSFILFKTPIHIKINYNENKSTFFIKNKTYNFKETTKKQKLSEVIKFLIKETLE